MMTEPIPRHGHKLILRPICQDCHKRECEGEPYRMNSDMQTCCVCESATTAGMWMPDGKQPHPYVSQAETKWQAHLRGKKRGLMYGISLGLAIGYWLGIAFMVYFKAR